MFPFPLSYLLFAALMIKQITAQYGPHNYPDPRTDPLSCHNLLPSQICDPADILQPEERRILNDKIVKLQQLTAGIRNSAPFCANGQNANLYLVIALMNRLSGVAEESASIERFANQLRNRYSNYQDASQCDVFVLIVNSKLDRQVFTVAGRDAKLSREVLQTAFHRHVGYFRVGSYALGLEGMIEYIVSAYTSAHLVQVPSSGDVDDKSISTNSITPPFVAAQGVRQKTDHRHAMEKFNIDTVPEEDRVWVDIMLKATALCGYNADKMSRNVRAVVEDAMSLSLKLISDTRYNKIEEASQDAASGENAREKAWEAARNAFIDRLYETYGPRFPRRANHCPAIQSESAGSVIEALMHRK